MASVKIFVRIAKVWTDCCPGKLPKVCTGSINHADRANVPGVGVGTARLVATFVEAEAPFKSAKAVSFRLAFVYCPTTSVSPSKLAVYNSDSSHSGPANRGNQNDLPYFTKDFEHGRGTVEMVRDSECM